MNQDRLIAGFTLAFVGFVLTGLTSATVIMVSGEPPSGNPVVDLSQLTTYTGDEVATYNPSGYATVDFPNLNAGDTYLDPSTGVTVWKITDSSTPSGGPVLGLVNEYPTLGRPITPCWGDPCLNYTLWITNPLGGTGYFYDFNLLTGPSNYRAAPTSQGSGHFSVAEPQIFYYADGTQLQRYDSATDSLANTGNFPYTWATQGGFKWFHCTDDDSWCGSMNNASADITMIRLSDGFVNSQSFVGMDEPYLNGVDGNIDAFAGAANPEECWNVTTDVVSSYTEPFITNPFHTHMVYDPVRAENIVVHFDVDTGLGRTEIAVMPMDQCSVDWPSSGNTLQSATATTAVLDASEPWTDDEINLLSIHIVSGTGSGQRRELTDYVASTRTATISSAWTTTPDATSGYELHTFVRGYPNDIHSTMWASQMPDGHLYQLWTNNRDGAFTPDSWTTSIFFVNVLNGSKIHVGATYNLYNSGIFSGSGAYYDEGHCTISPDGILVQCGVNGNGSTRNDVALWVLPYTTN